MKEQKIELITCESGDWEVLKLNEDVYFEGHKVESDTWIELLVKLNCNTKAIEISDEDMESGNY